MEYLSLIATCIDIFSYGHIIKKGVNPGHSKIGICISAVSSTLWTVHALSKKDILYSFAATSGFAFQLFILSKVFEKERQIATVKSNT